MGNKIELPNASEVDKLVSPWDEKEFDRIANAIIRKVKQRQHILNWPYKVSEPVRLELNRRGYLSKPSFHDFRDDSYMTTFDWSKKDLENILNGKY